MAKKDIKNLLEQLSFMFDEELEAAKENPASKPSLSPKKQAPPVKNEEETTSRFARVEAIFRQKVKRPWQIVWTKNRRNIIVYWRHRKPPKIHLHEMFADADEAIIGMIADVAVGHRKDWPEEVNAFIQSCLALASEGNTLPKPKGAKLVARGLFVDLQPLFDGVNERYFEGKIEAEIGWIRPLSKRPRKFQIGLYDEAAKRIRIHPILDTEKAPNFVIESVIFHEMVHAEIGTPIVNGKHVIHGKAFHERMNDFPRLKEAEAWIEKQMNALLSEHQKTFARRRFIYYGESD